MTKEFDVIYLLNDSGGLERVPMSEYQNEDLLQSMVEKYPELLAGDQINSDDPVRWMMVRREAGISDKDQGAGRWSLDHFLLDQNAIPTFVETKRSSDTRIRREVVGQMLDYAANAQKYWPVSHIRSMTETQFGGKDAAELALLALLELNMDEDNSAAIEDYWKQVEDNLRHGHVRLLFVADKLPAELKRVIEFLNEQMKESEVLGVELPQYSGSKIKALVPRVIGMTEAIKQEKQRGSAKSRLTQSEFLDTIPGVARAFFEKAITESVKRGMETYWGSSGFSLRSSGALNKPSLFYGFPRGGTRHNGPVAQGYVGNIKDIELREKTHSRFLGIPRTVKSGQYTVTLELDSESIENAWKLIELVWEINDKLTEDTSILSS